MQRHSSADSSDGRRADLLDNAVRDARDEHVVARDDHLDHLGHHGSGGHPVAHTAVPEHRENDPPPTPNKTPTPAPQPAAPTTPAQTGTFESQVLALVNAERTAAGLRPLAAQPCPDGFAEPWSPRMAAAGSLSHQSLGPILTRCDARTAAENVGMNSSQSPISMVAAFMGSPPHRANILNPAYTGIGIGAYRDARGVWWLTQDFVG